jgi:hypothetical protein
MQFGFVQAKWQVPRLHRRQHAVKRIHLPAQERDQLNISRWFDDLQVNGPPLQRFAGTG